MTEKIDPGRREGAFTAAAFALLALFIFWRASYGYCYEDEPFLLTLAQRLYMGDILIVDEWHGCQNFALVLLPLYRVYRAIFGTNDGIMLFFRYSYCVIWLAVLIVLYLKLHRVSRRGALAGCIYIGLFSPLDYMTLSYTSVSLMCVMLMASIIYCDILTEKKSPLKTGFTLGVLTTVSTLCYPMFAAVFVLWLIIALAAYAFSDKASKEKYTYMLRIALAMLSVCAVCAAAYIIWLTKNASLERITANFPMIFSDPQHKSRGLFESLLSLIKKEIQVGKFFYGAMALLTSAAIFSKNRTKIRIWLLAAALPIWAYCQLPLLTKPWVEYLNTQMKGIVFVGILAFTLMNKKPWRLFLSFYGLSMVYTVDAYMSSNTGLTVTAMCMSVAGIAAVIIIVMLGAEMHEQYKHQCRLTAIAALTASALVLLQLGLEATVRMRYTYYDDKITALTEKIDVGPARGLRTTPQNAAKYTETYNTFNALLPKRERENKTLLVYGGIPWLYLEADMKFDTLSSWLMGDPQVYTRLEKYYEINNREYPDIIYVEYIPENVPKGYEMTAMNGAALLKKTQ